jgi:hypothetical protein
MVTMQEPGLTFEAAPDTLSQHRANFPAGRTVLRKCCLLYKVDDENSDTIC